MKSLLYILCALLVLVGFAGQASACGGGQQLVLGFNGGGCYGGAQQFFVQPQAYYAAPLIQSYVQQPLILQQSGFGYGYGGGRALILQDNIGYGSRQRVIVRDRGRRSTVIVGGGGGQRVIVRPRGRAAVIVGY